MPFQKGKPKTGGRVKGVPNKTTSFHEACKALKFDVLACLIQGLDQMPPFQQVEYLTKILEYYYPKQRTMELSSGENGFHIVIDDYSKK